MNSAWLDRTLVRSPFYYCLCLTKKQFRHKLKECGIDENERHKFTKDDDSGKARWYESNGKQFVFICLTPNDHDLVEVHGLLVHEAIHMWQWIKEYYGEEAPSKEFEAYSLQNITQSLFEEYERQTKKGKKC